MKYYKLIIDDNANRRIMPDNTTPSSTIFLQDPRIDDVIHDDFFYFDQGTVDNFGLTLSKKAIDVFIDFNYNSCLIDLVIINKKEEFYPKKFKEYGKTNIIISGVKMEVPYFRIQFYIQNPTYIQSVIFEKSIFKKRLIGKTKEVESHFKNYQEYLCEKAEYEIKFEKIVFDKNYEIELGDLFYLEKTPNGYYPNNEIYPNGYKNDNKAICSERLKKAIEENNL
ncbi:MAG: hypothetical protein MUF43_12640, partial [Flavobacterium sp.]|nr:hypothetical protein [Flavobacterium sp.]